MKEGLWDVVAWKRTLPDDMRPEEKRLAFRKETHWTLQNVRGATGEALFNMLFDAIVERPDPMWYWKLDRMYWGGMRGMDQAVRHELWNVFHNNLDMTTVAIASPDKDGGWPCHEWWETEHELNRQPVQRAELYRFGREAQSDCRVQMSTWAKSKPDTTTSINLGRLLRHAQRQGDNPRMDNGGWVQMEDILRLLNARAERERHSTTLNNPQPRVRACHILAVARYGEGNPVGAKGVAHRFQVAVIKEPSWMAEVDIRDQGVPNREQDEALVARGGPPIEHSTPRSGEAYYRVVPIGVRCVQGHSRTVATQDPTRTSWRKGEVDDSPP